MLNAVRVHGPTGCPVHKRCTVSLETVLKKPIAYGAAAGVVRTPKQQSVGEFRALNAREGLSAVLPMLPRDARRPLSTLQPTRKRQSAWAIRADERIVLRVPNVRFHLPAAASCFGRFTG